MADPVRLSDWPTPRLAKWRERSGLGQIDPPPRRILPRAKMQNIVAKMCRGDWKIVAHQRADSLSAAAKALGGRTTRYRVSKKMSCFIVLEAPWKD